MGDESGEKLVGVEGDVKWFDSKKGFGFIVGPEGQDVFIHYTQISGDGFRALSDGQRVEYDATKGDRGWNATRVEVLASEVTVRKQGVSARSPRR